jgi:hypothetical protein
LTPEAPTGSRGLIILDGAWEPERWIEDSAPAYGIGNRLLVSGMPRRGGAALTDAIAWGCGFTRYYDKATADSWRAAFD